MREYNDMEELKVRDSAAHNGTLILEKEKADSEKVGAKKMYIESYGCQMNFSDSEIVASILKKSDYHLTGNFMEADLILINTCSIRDKAEQTIRKRLRELQKVKKQKRGALIGILGCMAERLKHKLLEEEKIVDVVAGPDAYRSLPALVKEAEEGFRSINVLLSREETYADISPIRLNPNGVSAFVSIMRGCDNMCSFCVVPFTRGRERSRPPESIRAECRELFDKGYREVTLLGQNVDSYCHVSESGKTTSFADLLALTAEVDPFLRVRFSTSHPKDIKEEALAAMNAYPNICKYIHLPAQSGSSTVLDRMNRKYTREWYLDKVKMIRQHIPDCGISSDIIAGFCGETEEEHRETLSLMELCRFDYAYMFTYSEREGTYAAKRMEDDIPLEVKKRRLSEIMDIQSKLSLANLQTYVGKTVVALIEGDSKRSADRWMGRNDQNQVVVFDKKENTFLGDYARVKILSCTGGTLIGAAID